SRCGASPSSSPTSSSSCCARSRPSPGASSAGGCCSRPCGRAPTTATRGRSTCTSATCARSSSRSRGRRSTSSRSAASATGSGTDEPVRERRRQARGRAPDGGRRRPHDRLPDRRAVLPAVARERRAAQPGVVAPHGRPEAVPEDARGRTAVRLFDRAAGRRARDRLRRPGDEPARQALRAGGLEPGQLVGRRRERPGRAARLPGGGGPDRGRPGGGRGRFAEVAAPVGSSSVVLLRASLHDQFEAVGVVRRRVFLAGALATAFALLLGYAGASLFARRIRRLETSVERIALGDFDAAIVDHGTDEVAELARAFERMRLRLATLDRARGEFIANASHELRTPLFSLGGFLELLDDPELDDATRDEFLARMREQVERLTRLATNLLDLSRLDAGRLTVASEVIELSELADELAAELRPRAEQLAHRLHVETAGEPVSALADAERVLQIGRILLENALVHTPAGTTVRVATAHQGGRATLTVANDG